MKARHLQAVVAIATPLILIVIPYYPPKLAFLLASVLLAFTCAVIWNPSASIFSLMAIAPFFGNHPGGRFMEIYILLCSAWLIGMALRRKLQLPARFPLYYSLYLVLLILPLLLHPAILQAALFYKDGLFYLLNANEHSPLYPLQQTVWLAMIPLLAVTARPYRGHIVFGVSAGLILTLAVGLLEILWPAIPALLDRVHIFVDGYVDRTMPHSILPVSGRDSYAPNSLFWNRSWHAVYIIASLPFISLFAYDRMKAWPSRKQWASVGFLSLLLTLYLLAVGARGAFVAYLAFLAIAGAGLLLIRFGLHRLVLAFPLLVITGALLLQLIVPLLIVFTEQGKTEYRYPQFAAAFNIFNMFPFFGGGTESYGYYNTVHLRAAAQAAKHGSSHNQLLQIAVGNGLAGVVFYAGLLLAFAAGIRKRMMAALGQREEMIPLLLITAGMAGCLVYGSVQEWNYLRPVMVMWAVLLFFAWPETKQSETSQQLWILAPLLLALSFSFRQPFQSFLATRQSDASATEPRPFAPTAPWQGVEYIDPDRFIVLQGDAHILLSPGLQPGEVSSLHGEAMTELRWSPGGYLRIRCLTSRPYRFGDIDARKLCAEITIPGSSQYFRSLEDPRLYRERTDR